MLRDTLRKKRKSLGLTQAEVAARAGINRTSLIRFERGSRTPGVDVAQRIASVLESTVEELFPITSVPRKSAAND